MPPICKGCGQPIYGIYITALGANWHPAHFVCAVCNKPLDGKSFYQLEGRPYHVDFYRQHIAARCAYCGKPLIGSYLMDGWGTKYCIEHAKEYPACQFCGRLVPARYQGASAGTDEPVRCPLCRANAIDSMAQAHPIFTGLVAWINRQGLFYNDLELRIKLCERSDLASLLQRDEGGRVLGATWYSTYIQQGQVTQTVVNGVAIMRGLPVPLFHGVTIHELGHAWLVVHRVTTLPLWAEEGFCELLAHRFYTEMATETSKYYALRIERNADRVYGEGFKHIQTLAQAIGFQRLIDVLCTTRQLPAD